MIETKKQVGITVLPEYFQTEGIEQVLDRLIHQAGATAVATSPYVMAVADEQSGSREPPIDAGAGSVRLLDRPLWGKRELFVRTAPSFVPDVRLYQGQRYQPAPANDLTQRDGHIIADFIRSAHARHLKVYFQIQAAIPPGYRVQFGGPVEEDIPRRPDGTVPPRRVSKNGSLASPAIRQYLNALLRDLLRVYPDIDGIRLDWPEYPPYFLDEAFLDFSEPARVAAKRHGMDVGRMQRDALALFQHLHGGLTDDDLDAWSQPDGGRFGLLLGLARFPGMADLLRLKSLLVEELLAEARQTITAVAGERVALVPNAFASPWTAVSGFDFARAARHCQGASTKAYTMHWAMMLNFYGTALLAANPRLTERKLVRALVSVLDLADGGDDAGSTLADYAYPDPDTPHPVSSAVIERKMRQAQRQAGRMPVYALAHGYGPLIDFTRRLQAAWAASSAGVWVNRYCYLTDEKLDAIGSVCR